MANKKDEVKKKEIKKVDAKKETKKEKEAVIREVQMNLKKEFDILEVLSQNPGQVFDKERLYEAAWGLDGLGNNTVVAEHIRKIRAKFAEAGAKQYIETVWGVGYKWEKPNIN